MSVGISHGEETLGPAENSCLTREVGLPDSLPKCWGLVPYSKGPLQRFPAEHTISWWQVNRV